MSEKNESIARYTPAELRALREKGNTGTDWQKLQAMPQQDVDAQAESDDDYFKDEAFWRTLEFDGGNKKIIGVLVDADVEAFYKQFGGDCQNTINAVLKAYMLIQEHRV